MNNLFRNMFLVILAALVLSTCFMSMSRAGMSTTNQTIYLDDPNDPGDLPEMVPDVLNLGLISEDPNDPGSLPE